MADADKIKPDFSGKVSVRVPEMFFHLPHLNTQYEVRKKLYRHYMDMSDEAPIIKSHTSADGRAIIFEGAVDQVRWPLSPTVLG